jgi:hypothetical protein
MLSFARYSSLTRLWSPGARSLRILCFHDLLDTLFDFLCTSFRGAASVDPTCHAGKENEHMAQQDMNRPWELFGLGSATSQGYKERIEGSAHIFAYGYSGASTDYIQVPSVDITSWAGEKRTVRPATKETGATALTEMSVTETAWTL